MNDNMPKHSLRTTFNSTEPTRMPQKAPWIPPVRKDTTLQNLKKTFDTVGDYKDSYENMGIPGLLGHYLENTGRIGKGNFKMDFPNMSMRYKDPSKKWGITGKAGKHGGSIGIDYEF